MRRASSGRFRLFDRCFFSVRVAIALELRLERAPAASPGGTPAERDEDLADRADPSEDERADSETSLERERFEADRDRARGREGSNGPACRCCCAPWTGSPPTPRPCLGRSRRRCRRCANSWRTPSPGEAPRRRRPQDTPWCGPARGARRIGDRARASASPEAREERRRPCRAPRGWTAAPLTSSARKPLDDVAEQSGRSLTAEQFYMAARRAARRNTKTTKITKSVLRDPRRLFRQEAFVVFASKDSAGARKADPAMAPPR